MPGVPDFGDYDGLNDHIDGIGGYEPGVQEWGVLGGIVPGSGGSGACEKVTFSVRNWSMEIPNDQGCAALADIRAVIAWFLYAMTVRYVWLKATERPA
jgi:hypothetical protein